METGEYRRLTTEKGIAAVIRSAEIWEEEARRLNAGERPLPVTLLKRIAELQVIAPAIDAYGSLTAALEVDEILRDRLMAYEKGRQGMIHLKQSLRGEFQLD